MHVVAHGEAVDDKVGAARRYLHEAGDSLKGVQGVVFEVHGELVDDAELLGQLLERRRSIHPSKGRFIEAGGRRVGRGGARSESMFGVRPTKAARVVAAMHLRVTHDWGSCAGRGFSWLMA